MAQSSCGILLGKISVAGFRMFNLLLRSIRSPGVWP